MWRDWLPFSDIVGIDIAEPTPIKNVQTFLLDGTKKETASLFGSFDLIIDDGSHMTADQIKTFKLFWGKCKYAYILEDIHTSFRKQYINSKVTAYDYIHQFIKDNNLKFKEFWNVEDKSESGTIIIFK
jgi:23S rRNA U2552 (ribose-2'-O)-methylase RlmE/FtsJ